MDRRYAAVIVKTEGWFVGYVPELPGDFAQGETVDERRENLREAIQLILVSSQNERPLGPDATEVVREELAVSIT